MNKTEIIQSLGQQFDRVISLIEQTPESQLAVPLEPGKWSIGQHAWHLVLSTRPVTKGMHIPHTVLSEKFGVKAPAEQRSAAEVFDLYENALRVGFKAPPQFDPADADEVSKTELTEHLRQVLSELSAVTEQWEESDLSTYVLPHPALGPLTIRDMLYFTIYHTGHHLKPMQQA